MTARSTKAPTTPGTDVAVVAKATKSPAKIVAKKAPAKVVAKVVAPKAEATPTVDLFARVEAARALGFSRRVLQSEAGLDGTTAMYRTERMGTEEAAKLTAVLVKIETGKITPPVKVAASASASLRHRVTEATALLTAAQAEKTVTGARARIAEALELLNG